MTDKQREWQVPADNYTAVDLQVLKLKMEPAKIEAERYMVRKLAEAKARREKRDEQP
ncbi:MAG: hypothetical protein AB7I34_22120 [Rhizobiaceae bacterium]